MKFILIFFFVLGTCVYSYVTDDEMGIWKEYKNALDEIHGELEILEKGLGKFWTDEELEILEKDIMVCRHEYYDNLWMMHRAFFNRYSFLYKNYDCLPWNEQCRLSSYKFLDDVNGALMEILNITKFEYYEKFTGSKKLYFGC